MGTVDECEVPDEATASKMSTLDDGVLERVHRPDRPFPGIRLPTETPERAVGLRSEANGHRPQHDGTNTYPP